jgi:predicted molibdopterin-dependent oxidoreductase YjgC
MPDKNIVSIMIDGDPFEAASGSTVAAAILNSGGRTFRTSVNGEPRAPVCGMGICFECRVKVDGVENVRSCMEAVREGMEVVTDG